MSGYITTVRATYDCTYWPSDEPDTDPAMWGGWCDPANPWGTADDDYDPESDDVYGLGDIIELDMPWDEAARFIADFPGGVWDLGTDCDPSQDYRTGVYTRVTLHVHEDTAGGLALREAERIMFHPERRITTS